MLDDEAKALAAITFLTAFSHAMQTLELWTLRESASDGGVWSLARLRSDLNVFPRPVAGALAWLLSYRAFLVLLALRAVSCLGLWIEPHLAFVLVLLSSSVLIALRWRGSFNGGSDFMGLVVLSALSIAYAFPQAPLATRAALWYVAIHACNSYFLAGVVKARAPSWRRGQALPAFLRHGIYDNTGLAAFLQKRPNLSVLACLGVIVLECLFPVALLDRSLCVALIGLAFGFHLVNAYLFGLNRFLWAWASTYPALLYCSGRLL